MIPALDIRGGKCVRLRQGKAEEETVLMVKVGVLKEKLAALRLRGELKVDPDALLAELQTLSGPRDRLAEDLKEEEASQMLSELKRRLENENP